MNAGESPLVAEFRDHLARLRGRPEELATLLRLGLEREALVSVAYRADSVGGRLGRMPIDADVARVAARAIRWIWREEEGHTLWIRGALLRGPADVPTLATAVRGRVMGWVSSRQAHLRWREAPVRRAVAEALERVGRALGEVPDAVADRLRFLPFREFCAFQRDAELTAHLGWSRVAELCADGPDAHGFRRLAADEARHARVLGTLAEAFDEADRAVLPAAELEARLGAIGRRFVARPGPLAHPNPLGKGGTVIVREGPDGPAVAREALAALGLPAGKRVALKSTWMLLADRADPSPAVSRAVLGAVVGALEARGNAVTVLDGPNLYDRFHHGRSVIEVARYYGWSGPVTDASADPAPLPEARGVGEEVVARAWRDADFRVVVGKLRTHPTLGFYGALGASEGLGVRQDRTVFLDRRAEQATTVLRTLDGCPPDLCVVDAHTAVPDGLLGFFGDPRARDYGRIYASGDGLALDRVLARHAGFRALPPLVREALDWFGDAEGPVDGPDTPLPGFRPPDGTRRSALLARLAWPVWLGSGEGAAFLPPFDEAAFPRRLERARVRRALVRAALGPRRA